MGHETQLPSSQDQNSDAVPEPYECSPHQYISLL